MAIIALSVVGASASGDLAGYEATDHGGLLHILRSRGHDIVEPSDPSATHFVAMDHNRASFHSVASRVPVGRRQLVVFEPRVVLPDNYKRTVRKHYGSVLSVGVRADMGSRSALAWPQRDWRAHPTPTGKHSPGTSVLINANKNSMISGSLYGLRRRVIVAFDQMNLPLTLAGSNWGRTGRDAFIENGRAVAYALVNHQKIDLAEWNRGLPLDGSVTDVGTVSDKQAVLADCEFAVVIENSATYFSEKLFDVIAAGCVPLYVGPPLADLAIPDGVAVQLDVAARPADFIDAVLRLGAEQKDRVLQSGREWLAEESTWQTWAMPGALERLAKAIDSTIAAGIEKA